jgi:hypothetical protein
VIDKTGILVKGGGGLLLQGVNVPTGGTRVAANKDVAGINSVL